MNEIALVLLALAVVRSWTSFVKSNNKGENPLPALVVAISTTWAYYVIASEHISIE